MSELTGKLIVCDRCGNSYFLKCIGEGEADGGKRCSEFRKHTCRNLRKIKTWFKHWVFFFFAIKTRSLMKESDILC